MAGAGVGGFVYDAVFSYGPPDGVFGRTAGLGDERADQSTMTWVWKMVMGC